MMIDRHEEERIRSWLMSVAPGPLPDHVLPAAFDRTRRLAQRSGRRRWASIAARSMPIAFAASAVSIVLVAISLQFGSQDLGPAAAPVSVTVPIGGLWTTDSDIAFTVRRDPADVRAYYWRAITYDQVGLNEWRSSPATSIARPAGARILGGTADDVDQSDRRSITFTVVPETFKASTVLSPATPVSVDQDTTLRTVGIDGFFSSLERAGEGRYTVTALVAEVDSADGMVDASTLRAAGTDYPADMVNLYTQVPAAVLGPNLHVLRDEIVASAESSSAYDIATRLVEVLRGPGYTYDTDVRDLDCATRSTAECFATFKSGYCEYYATTMAVVLRDLGIPTRLVAGFLPGSRLPGSSTEVVRMSSVHAWVEVYFPGYGWVAFDPTGGGATKLPAPLPSGPPTGS